MNLKQELQLALIQSLTLHKMLDKLREFKIQGGKQTQALRILESLRKTAQQDGQEDKLLEVMDYVVGFCSPNKVIWND